MFKLILRINKSFGYRLRKDSVGKKDGVEEHAISQTS